MSERLMEEDKNLRERNFACFEGVYGRRPGIDPGESGKYRMEKAMSGAPVLSVRVTEDGRTAWIPMNSRYDPEYEAARWALSYTPKNRRTTFVMQGFAAGYQLKALLQYLRQDTEFFIFEPEEGLFAYVCAFMDLTGLIRDPRVHIYLRPDPYVFRHDLERDIIPHNTQTIGTRMPFYQENADFNEAFRAACALQVTNNNYQRIRGRRTLTNRLYSWIHLNRNYTLDALFHGLPKDIPVIIAAGGPSLNKNVEDLKAAKGRALIVCIDRALKTLLKHGILPDLIATIDVDKDPAYLIPDPKPVPEQGGSGAADSQPAPEQSATGASGSQPAPEQVGSEPSVSQSAPEQENSEPSLSQSVPERIRSELSVSQSVPEKTESETSGLQSEQAQPADISEIPMLCSFKANYESQQLFDGRLIYFCAWEEENALPGIGGRLPLQGVVGGNVAAACYTTFAEAGQKTVILIGQDLANLGSITHADGSDDGALVNDDFIEVEGIDGKPVQSHEDWIHFRDYYEEMILRYPGTHVVDATEGGALIHGSEVMTLKAAIRRECGDVTTSDIVKEKISDAGVRLSQSDPDVSGFKDLFSRMPHAQSEDDHRETIARLRNWCHELEEIHELAAELESECRCILDTFCMPDADSNDTAGIMNTEKSKQQAAEAENGYRNISDAGYMPEPGRLEHLIRIRTEIRSKDTFRFIADSWLTDKDLLPDRNFIYRDCEELQYLLEREFNFAGVLLADAMSLRDGIIKLLTDHED